MTARRKRPPTRIQRSGNGHSYYLDGEKVPGVTTILGNGIPKPALVGWAANTTADFVVDRLSVDRDTDRIVADELVEELISWNDSRSRPVKISKDRLPRLGLAKILSSIRYRDTDQAAKRGQEVHRLAESLARGDEIEVPPEIAGHVESYVRFLDEWQPTNALLERVIVNRRYRYMGRVDLMCEIDELGDRLGLDRPARCLLDLKTSRSGIFFETALQLHGYEGGEVMLGDDGSEVELPEFDFLGAVWVRGDGYDLIPIERRPETFRAFLYAQQIAQAMDRDEGLAASAIGAALSPPGAT